MRLYALVPIHGIFTSYNSLHAYAKLCGSCSHYAINQLSATTPKQLYLGSQTTCATVMEQYM